MRPSILVVVLLSLSGVVQAGDWGQWATRPVSKLTWQQAAALIKALPPDKRVKAVNAYVNSFPYRDDWATWQVHDYWATPDEFLEKGGGDCEDYAIAKYALLRMVGVPRSQMSMLIGASVKTGAGHAVLLVGGEVLDNNAAQPYHYSEFMKEYDLLSVKEVSYGQKED